MNATVTIGIPRAQMQCRHLDESIMLERFWIPLVQPLPVKSGRILVVSIIFMLSLDPDK